MSGDLEARVVQAAREAVAADVGTEKWPDVVADLLAGKYDDEPMVHYAILGGRAALAEIDVIGLMTAAYAAGFKRSGEGYNAEYPFDDEFEADEEWAWARDNKITFLLNKRAAPPPNESPRPDRRASGARS